MSGFNPALVSSCGLFLSTLLPSHRALPFLGETLEERGLTRGAREPWAGKGAVSVPSSTKPIRWEGGSPLGLKLLT